jgi:O-antigen/teichoic acid export membrane protein
VPSLRQRVVRGASFMLGRWALSSIISIVNLFLITAIIGPANFGTYVTAVGIVGYLGLISHLGIDVYLIRSDEEPSARAYDQALTVLALSSIALVGIGFAILYFLLNWLENDQLIGPYLILLLFMPLASLALPAFASLERELDYRSVALIELAAQLSYGVVGASLAFYGAGVWAPVAGQVVSQTLRVAAVWTVSGLWPRFYWSQALLGDMLRYGIGYSSSNWIFRLRGLVNPLIVGGFLGPEAVALVGLAIRVTIALSAVRRATWRLALVVMAKVQQDSSRTSRVMDEAMLIQVMALGPFLGGFAVLAPWLLPHFYGPEWQGLLTVYPFIALGVLVNAVFNMHSSQLYVRKHNLDVAVFHLVHIALFAGAAVVLVWRFGLVGYGYAEVVALCSYWVIHAQLLKFMRPSYGAAALWLAAYIPPLFTPLVELAWAPLLWLPFVAVVLLPRSRRQIQGYIAEIFQRRSTA